MKAVLAGLLEGSILSPILATVLGAVIGMLTFVILNSAGHSISVAMHYGIAIVVGLVAAGAINLFLKPNVHISE